MNFWLSALRSQWSWFFALLFKVHNNFVRHFLSYLFNWTFWNNNIIHSDRLIIPTWWFNYFIQLSNWSFILRNQIYNANVLLLFKFFEKFRWVFQLPSFESVFFTRYLFFSLCFFFVFCVIKLDFRIDSGFFDSFVFVNVNMIFECGFCMNGIEAVDEFLVFFPRNVALFDMPIAIRLLNQNFWRP